MLIMLNGFVFCILYLHILENMVYVKRKVVNSGGGIICLGCIVNDKCISLVESEDMMLIRRFSIMSWLMAILFESVLAFIINWFHFRKVNNMKVSDMNR